MQTTHKPDKRFHVRKKVAGGMAGAVAGAFVAGPVGALAGGVIGTLVGGAAEKGRLQALANTKGARPGANVKARTKPATKKARSTMPVASKRKARSVRPKTTSSAKRRR